MSEVVKIFLTSGLTILGGLFIFVVGQILSKFYIEPIHEQRKAIGAVGEALIFLQVVIEKQVMAGEEIKKVDDTLRRCGSELLMYTHAIPWYPFWERLKFVRPKSDIFEACVQLVALSGSRIAPELIKKPVNKIITALDIKILLGELE